MSQDVVAGPRTTSPALALVRAARPRQWLKNVLVLAAPLAAGVLGEPRSLLAALSVFVAFCLAASGSYLLNDASDVEADRLHPRKKHRPIASGAVSVRTARVTGVALLLLAPVVAAPAGRWESSAVVAGYVALTLSYTVWLKHQEVVDLIAVAGCHVIRAYAGAVAVDVPVTGWFLVVVSLAALQLVVGKREAELRAQGVTGTRATLASYSPAYLAQVRVMCSGAMIVTYCLWALNAHADLFYGLSIIPFLLLVLRHNLLVDRGRGEEPEELAARDRPILLFAVGLIVLVALGIYI
ncbi:decaprenyl-phosphate phosphoribosyltransferase [Nonomuraea turkmeniaca]|uniref:Decaprenyl-phosphate phosphoribosyltransferase n=1 Tax=Nonomuraea turkmeniaca TaxID=103838 RepID=A0A5S4FK16_9ACTN|nr:decaprenyl-phosphate phosphoribosyltransferase [Nonomuraea turkmeniaca]TMR21078.1 decaprenyl-phosphate phosphoribosyltransferase [Nonomuraea turkmeniaca]